RSVAPDPLGTGKASTRRLSRETEASERAARSQAAAAAARPECFGHPAREIAARSIRQETAAGRPARQAAQTPAQQEWPIKLYVADKAPNPDRVKYFLREKGKWDAVPRVDLSIMNKEHKQPGYLALSPLNQVPALELDDGTALTESRAICTYFEGLYPEPNLMGEDFRERAHIEMWDRRVELLYLFVLAGWF